MGNVERELSAGHALALPARAGMTTGMTSAKVAISLRKDVLSRARAAVRRGEAPSLSAYVSLLIEEKAIQGDLMSMLNEMLEETGGPPTAAEIRWADEALGVAKPRARRSVRK